MRSVLSSSSEIPEKHSDWGLEHYIVDSIQPLKSATRSPPVFMINDPLPVLSEISCHIFILAHSIWPLLLQELYPFIWQGSPLPAWATLATNIAAYYIMMFREATGLHQIGKRVGYLDGASHNRDRIPFHDAHKVLFTVTFFATTRPCLTFLLGYLDASKTLPAISCAFPIKLLLYPVLLDLWFYLYHRACHEVQWLWRYHRTHHLTKHPIPILASYSDFEQETIEAIIVPLATYLSMKHVLKMPLSFPELWICQAYILFEEVIGHSGLRLYAVAPTLASPLLRLINCELVIEDHDLHHRKGWKRSFNYGKQTRLWDQLMGTTAPRVETSTSRYGGTVHMNWF